MNINGLLATFLTISLSGGAWATAGERKAEFLTRDDNPQSADCLNTAPGPHGGNALGIATGDYLKNGWVQNGGRNGISPWNRYQAKELAISSPVCQRESKAWIKAYKKCEQQGFEPVHLYLSLDADSEDEIGPLAEKDSWMRVPGQENDVVQIQAHSRKALKHVFEDLAMECKVIDFAFIDSHGNSEILAVGDTDVVSINWFMSNAISPCWLSPKAKLQFAGCDVACGSGAESIRRTLETRFAEIHDDRPAGSAEPFNDVKLLMNSDTGYVGWAFGWGIFEHIGVHSDNNLAFVYTVHGKTVTSDFPTALAPSCEPTEHVSHDVQPIHHWR